MTITEGQDIVSKEIDLNHKQAPEDSVRAIAISRVVTNYGGAS